MCNSRENVWSGNCSLFRNSRVAPLLPSVPRVRSARPRWRRPRGGPARLACLTKIKKKNQPASMSNLLKDFWKFQVYTNYVWKHVMEHIVRLPYRTICHIFSFVLENDQKVSLGEKVDRSPPPSHLQARAARAGPSLRASRPSPLSPASRGGPGDPLGPGRPWRPSGPPGPAGPSAPASPEVRVSPNNNFFCRYSPSINLKKNSHNFSWHPWKSNLSCLSWNSWSSCEKKTTQDCGYIIIFGLFFTYPSVLALLLDLICPEDP